MLSTRTFAAALPICLLAALLLGACKEGDDGPQELGEIFTATPPDPLPTPLLLAQAAPILPAGNTYTVQAGDSLSGIADQFGISIDALMAANGITDPAAISEGQVLTIPGAAPAAPTEPPPVEPPPEAPPTEPPPEATPTPAAEGTTYVIQDGDIAAVIAEQNGLTIEELAAANNTTVDDLRELSVGDVIIIPPPAGE